MYAGESSPSKGVWDLMALEEVEADPVWSCAVSRTAGRPAEVLREGSGIGVDGAAGDGLKISAYIKDAGNLPKTPGSIYHQHTHSNDSRLGARTSFFDQRGYRNKQTDWYVSVHNGTDTNLRRV